MRLESKASSFVRGNSFSSSSLRIPNRADRSSRASSVGSPMRSPPSSTPSLHRVIPFKNSLCSSFPRSFFPSSFWLVKQLSTVILFWVRVPVLSEQTTLTAPSVSTEGSFLTMVCTFTILVTLNARQIVTTAGSPSGTAATARDMAVISISIRFLFCTSAMTKRAAQRSRDRMLSSFPSSPSLFCSGVSSSWLSLMREAIFPISVSIPVAVTIPSPRP